MMEVFTKYDVYSNDKMTKLNQHQAQQACTADRANNPIT